MKDCKNITTSELYAKLQEKSIILIDVREEEEFEAQRIKGAINIPMSDFSLDKIPENAKSIAFQCLSGKRSTAICKEFLENTNAKERFENTYSLEGGIKKWKADGFEIEE